MNALKLCKQVDRPDGLPGYQIAPGELYPTTFEAMQAWDYTQPAPAHLAPYVAQAQAMPQRAYDLVYDGPVTVDPDELNEQDRALRAGALELARLWFTAELRAAVEDAGQIVLMIGPKDPAWRL